jgi:hypothetical protein
MTTPLANTPADIVRQLLLDDGFSSVYALVLPPTPDICTTVFNTTDVIDARTMRGNLNIHFGIQIRVRDDSADDGAARAAEIQRWMAEDVLNAVVTGGVRLLTNSYKVYNFAKIGPVLKLGMDVGNDKRFNFTINALVVIRPIADT